MRSRNSLMRERQEAFRDARLIIIASEGKDTEGIYFKALANEYATPSVHVLLLKRAEGEENNSSPEHVYRQLLESKEQFSLEDDDELWLVIDKDRWTEGMVSEVAAKCARDPFMRMALSNPCFELWLLLHLEDVISLSEEQQEAWRKNQRKSKSAEPFLKVELRRLMGAYHESAYDASQLIPYVERAIGQARRLEKNPDDRWPQTLGTRVYLLAQSIMNRKLEAAYE